VRLFRRKAKSVDERLVVSGDTDRTQTIRLGEVAPGCGGTICKLECTRQLRRRLMDMGVISGTPFTVERLAPLGDPMELKLNGFNLSLRKEEAGDIWVEVPCD